MRYNGVTSATELLSWKTLMWSRRSFRRLDVRDLRSDTPTFLLLQNGLIIERVSERVKEKSFHPSAP